MHFSITYLLISVLALKVSSNPFSERRCNNVGGGCGNDADCCTGLACEESLLGGEGECVVCDTTGNICARQSDCCPGLTCTATSVGGVGIEISKFVGSFASCVNYKCIVHRYILCIASEAFFFVTVKCTEKPVKDSVVKIRRSQDSCIGEAISTQLNGFLHCSGPLMTLGVRQKERRVASTSVVAICIQADSLFDTGAGVELELATLNFFRGIICAAAGSLAPCEGGQIKR
ncbi:hypothetical protein GGX14DRAFT_388454 [Mycena pura]|uniref:Hydrophobin n=1 Tax=Mycena pura TaxID=153505 RepID=A0AAD6VT13_9AGAR|nr:hypothetical protein GGX14DRAFT_388454 [Mycena pura]